jgi:hypothetical protein
MCELAAYFSATRKIDIDLAASQLTNWNRNQLPSENYTIETLKVIPK